MSIDSPNALTSHLARMSLSHGALQDEDLTLTIADDDDTIGHSVSGAAMDDEDEDRDARRTAERQEVAFGGSMGAVTSQRLYSQQPVQATPKAGKAQTAVRLDATTPVNPTVNPGYDASDDQDDLDMDDPNATEEEKRRIAELREERDGLRVMNKTLRELLGGLQGVDAKLQVLGENIETAHGLLDLYSRIAAQAEHTQALLLDTQWQGVTHDAQMLVEREAEAARQAQEEAERLEQERIEAEEAAAAAAATAAEQAAQRKAAGGDPKRGKFLAFEGGVVE
ncbi:hypothetical protein OIV83_004691 [Microbotryomycetes sp. JL201]|nr:hypothetical protein OIV83_004691 [Microbotryomycetes sp. JL201]